MNNQQRKQILYQKTDFNHHKICQLNGVFICCKCKKNNNVMNHSLQYQNCIFCGTPNYITY